MIEKVAINKIEELLNIDLVENKDELILKHSYKLNEKGQISTLNLSYSKIVNLNLLVPELEKLESLTNLHLGDNQISDISALKKLPNLDFLTLNNNPIEHLTPIPELKKLRVLFMDTIKCTDFSVLRNAKNLRNLSLDNNSLTDISFIENHENLQSLYLKNNAISSVEPLKELKKLQRVDLRRNKLINIPDWIIDFGIGINLKDKLPSDSIALYGNPIETPPLSIIHRGKSAVQRYFTKISAEGIDYIYEAKLTLVGDGSAGKTSLQKRLLNANAPLPKKDNRTRGIKIVDWKFKKEKGKSYVAHIWDFGGQDVYYPVHRFFLTENSVFVLLASTRQTNHNFDYWIPTIYQFGGDSPIILGQTCFDGNKDSWTDISYYIGNSNFNIIKTQVLPYYELNLPKRNEGLLKIKQSIISQIINLPHYGKGVPTSWIPVRDLVYEEANKNSCISFEKFQTICRNSSPKGFARSIDIKDFAKFLHSIGVILWYSEIAELRNWVILKPEWAMNAVYKIIDDGQIQKRRGHIVSKDFNRLWKEEQYDDKHLILKKMLEVFKIAFQKKHRVGEYIIPARLFSMPNESRWKDNEPYLRLEYRFEFMPKGMVNQVSAELSRYIVSDDEVWNNAVNLTNENNTAFCQIEEDFYTRTIKIKAKGKRSRDLIILVMNALNDITDGYKGVIQKIYVPCTCHACKLRSEPTTFLYDDLLRWSSLRESALVTCNERGESLLIDDLLFNVGLEKEIQVKDQIEKTIDNQQGARRVFVSYSKHDEDYLQDFEDHLVTLKEEGLLTFNCREIEFGKEWDDEIKRQIHECDIMVCLVSVKFLNTDYIKKIEIENAIQQKKIIIPIIIKACDWETSVLGKYQAAQRGRVVSLNNNLKLLGRIKAHTDEEKAAFWNDITKEFRKKLIK